MKKIMTRDAQEYGKTDRGSVVTTIEIFQRGAK